jgi:hypothetical protein
MALSTTALGSFAPNKAPAILSAATGVVPQGGECYITYAGVCLATLAAPTADGIDLYIISLGAHAHVITTPADVVNGVDDTLTFGATALNYSHLKSFGGQWLQLDETGITLSEV